MRRILPVRADPEFMKAAVCGGDPLFCQVTDPRELPTDVEVVYTSRWRSMGQEKSNLKLAKFRAFSVTPDLMEKAGNPGTILMHDLPAERGAEIFSEVLDGHRSRILQQAQNKLYSAFAILSGCCCEISLSATRIRWTSKSYGST